MKLRLIYIIMLMLSVAFEINAQTTFPVSEIHFQEGDTIDIYADETAKIVNKITREEEDNIFWDIVISGDDVIYAKDFGENGSFTFAPPNPSTNEVKTYSISVNIKKLNLESSECLLDTTKIFHIRVFPKPYISVILRCCVNYDDDRGYTAIQLNNKDSQPGGILRIGTYSTHVLRLSVPSVSKDESYWEWSVADTTLRAGLGNVFKYRFSEEEGSGEGISHFYTIKVRNKLPYREEAFEDEYPIECIVYPIPEAGLHEHVETYSGRTAGFDLFYAGGIKDGWTITCQDYGLTKDYTIEEINNICKYVDEHTQFKYRISVLNGNDYSGYYHGVQYPVFEVWKKPVAELCNINGKDINGVNTKDAQSIICNEGDEITISYKVDGGYESDDSWVAFIDSTSVSSKDDNIVTCRYKVTIPDSIRNDTDNTECHLSLYTRIENLYTGENYSPDSIWYSDSILLNLTVHLCPLKPLSLTKKGNGNSGTVIASIDNNDPYLGTSTYGLVYGYECEDGMVVEHTKIGHKASHSYLYDIFTKEELADVDNHFYVYASVTTSQGEVVSDKCFMNGEEPAEEVTEVRKYDGNGRVSQATHGFVIVFMSDGTVRKTILK